MIKSVTVKVNHHGDLLTCCGWGHLHLRIIFSSLILTFDLRDPRVVGLLAPRLYDGDLKGAPIRSRVGHIGHSDSRTACYTTTWEVAYRETSYEKEEI